MPDPSVPTDGASHVASGLLPPGAWPVMLTPFDEEHAIDWPSLDAYTDWLIDQGSAGLFAVCLSSEMYDLSATERVALTRRVVERAAGRVPVVATAVWDHPEERDAAIAAIADTGVAAVVLVPSLLVGPAQDDDAWLDAVGHVLSAHPGVDFGVYECPLPVKRLLTTSAVAWLAQSGRFTFYKDTSDDLSLMAERIEVARGTRMRHYNAAIGSLTPSLLLGSSGLSGYAASVYPEHVAWLCEHATSGPSEQVDLVQRLMTVAELCINLRYPVSAKYLLDVSSRLSWRAVARWKPERIGHHEGVPLVQLGEHVRAARLPTAARVPGSR